MVVVDEPVGDDRDVLVPERGDVRRGEPRARDVVDADEEAARGSAARRRSRPAGGAPARPRPRDGRRACSTGRTRRRRRRAPPRPRSARRACRAAGAARSPSPRSPRSGPGGSRPRRVGERVGQPLGEHQPDRAAPAGPQPARGRVRPGVAELPWRSRAPSAAARGRAGRAGCRRWRPSCARRRGRRRSSAALPARPPGPFYRFAAPRSGRLLPPRRLPPAAGLPR